MHSVWTFLISLTSSHDRRAGLREWAHMRTRTWPACWMKISRPCADRPSHTPGKVSSGILNFTLGSDTQGIPSKLLQAKPLGDGLGVRDWWKGLVGSSLLGPLCLGCLENPKTGGQNWFFSPPNSFLFSPVHISLLLRVLMLYFRYWAWQ